MIQECRFIYPYFENEGMLKLQVENWNRFTGELREAIRIIVVDDHSKKSPVPILETCKAVVHCYRLDTRFPWNMHECRNIGAKEASTPAENHWLFMSDIDMMITPKMAVAMLSRELNPRHYYTMAQTFANNRRLRRSPLNMFLLKYNVFWQLNGYDLDLNPVGGGGYGGDRPFLQQLQAIAPPVHMDDVTLMCHGRSWRDGKPAIPDADTRSLDRLEWSKKYRKALERKTKSGDLRSVRPIRTGYQRVL